LEIGVANIILISDYSLLSNILDIQMDETGCSLPHTCIMSQNLLKAIGKNHNRILILVSSSLEAKWASISLL
jgi:hypothetical protein